MGSDFLRTQFPKAKKNNSNWAIIIKTLEVLWIPGVKLLDLLPKFAYVHFAYFFRT